MTDYTDTPIIVTGCARSGTSLVAGVLANCGVWIGKCTGPTQYNKRGQFENEYIRDQLTKPYLKNIGVDPMGQIPLPTADQIVPDPKWRSKVLTAMRDQGYDGSGPWMFKGAKACLIWQIWDEAFPNAQWVIVRRSTDRIVDSCMKTRFMHKRKTQESWQEWVEHHLECFRAMADAGLNINTIWPGTNNLSQYRDLVDTLGLTWNEEAVAGYVDPKLWGG